MSDEERAEQMALKRRLLELAHRRATPCSGLARPNPAGFSY